jgi:PAB-dependent poly(A)-specific ribonuclease subunit 3
MHERAEAKLAVDRSRDSPLPNEIHVYHSLHLLTASSTPQERSPRVFGFLTEVYRATCRLDGRLYCLRRIQGERTSLAIPQTTDPSHKTVFGTGYKLGKEAAFGVLDQWRRIRHPNIVSVREAFTTRLFSDNCMSHVLGGCRRCC